MLETVIVLVVVGILTAMAIPRLTQDRLQESADQILSHIRYTQHLAMMDDRFDPLTQNWYQSRWMISFRQCGGSWYYVIGRDEDLGGAIGKSESARNPADGKYLFMNNITCTLANDESSEILIGDRFGIDTISFSPGCGGNQYVAFDHLGRPYATTLGTYSIPNMYDIATNDCQIVFSGDSGSFTITVTAQSGYAYISSMSGN